MIKKRHNKKLIAVIFSVVYIFVALFSQNFHNHGSGTFFKEFHFKKTENSVSKSAKFSGYEDCFSCHLLYEGNSVVPKDFGFSFSNFSFPVKEPFYFNHYFLSHLQGFSFLRGPPFI